MLNETIQKKSYLNITNEMILEYVELFYSAPNMIIMYLDIIDFIQNESPTKEEILYIGFCFGNALDADLKRNPQKFGELFIYQLFMIYKTQSYGEGIRSSTLDLMFGAGTIATEYFETRRDIKDLLDYVYNIEHTVLKGEILLVSIAAGLILSKASSLKKLAENGDTFQKA